MECDFSSVGDLEQFTSVPAGRHLCEVAEVRVTERSDGTQRWALRWHVAAGPLVGRLAAWDGLNFNERGLPRVKFVLGRLGFPVDGALRVEPRDLEGARAWVTVKHEEYVDPHTQERKVAPRVAFAGYERFDPQSVPDPMDAPF